MMIEEKKTSSKFTDKGSKEILFTFKGEKHSLKK